MIYLIIKMLVDCAKLHSILKCEAFEVMPFVNLCFRIYHKGVNTS